MNYSKIYKDLTMRGKQDRDLGYVEHHHIIPKCMGGTDDADNISILTPEEHFVAHLLLVKMYPSNDKLVFAANMMSVASPKSQRRLNNKRHGWLRRLNAEAQRNRVFTDETRAKMSESALNRKKVKCPHCGKEGLSGNMHRWHFDNCRNSPTFDPLTRIQNKEVIAKRSKTVIANNKIFVKQSTCKWCGLSGNASAINSSHNDYCKFNPDQKKSKSRAGELKTCNHCGKQAAGSNFKRWHFDNCKQKIVIP